MERWTQKEASRGTCCLRGSGVGGQNLRPPAEAGPDLVSWTEESSPGIRLTSASLKLRKGRECCRIKALKPQDHVPSPWQSPRITSPLPSKAPGSLPLALASWKSEDHRLLSPCSPHPGIKSSLFTSHISLHPLPFSRANLPRLLLS